MIRHQLEEGAGAPMASGAHLCPERWAALIERPDLDEALLTALGPSNEPS